MAQLAKKPRTSIEMDEELKRVLECPVCLKVPRQGNVYQCKWGHCICSECQPGLTQCPTCRIDIGKNPGRNLVFENLLSKMTHGCKFSDQGCTFEGTYTPLETHEQDCEFRLVNCSSLSCKTQVSQSKLLEHMEKDHKKEEFFNRPHPATVQFTVAGATFNQQYPMTWMPSHIKFEGQHFFLQFWRKAGPVYPSFGGGYRDIGNTVGQWHVWVNMLASKKSCEGFIYTVKVSGQGLMEKEGASFSGRCVPLDHSKEKVAELGTCLIFSDTQAKRFWANGQIKIHVSIESV